MLLLFVSIGVGLLTAFLTLGWFFTTGEETDRSMAEWSRPFVPWWATKFGVWVMLSSTAGGITYVVLPSFFPTIFVPWAPH
jgi:hypothetical protein